MYNALTIHFDELPKRCFVKSCPRFKALNHRFLIHGPALAHRLIRGTIHVNR